MLNPKDIEITDQEGKTRKFVISKFPAVQGREIICQYPLTAIPKIGEYKQNEEIMLKAIKFAGVRINDRIQVLETQALVDNHTGDWETLIKLEQELMQYNCSFFLKGTISTFFQGLVEQVSHKITAILTGSLEQSSRKN